MTPGTRKKRKTFKQIFDAVQHTKALLDDVLLMKNKLANLFLDPQIFNFFPHK
jgi:hypothetical protein